MALQKQPIDINFAQGLDTKTDPKQVAQGKFLKLVNVNFKDGAGLSKRNGFGNRALLANPAGTTITTLNDNLVATGAVLQSYSENTNKWANQGITQPVELRVKSLVRNSQAQTQPDTALASNNLLCTVYMENGNSFYQITDATTGQSIVNHVQLPTTATNPRVNVLSNYFIITFGQTVISTPNLRYIAIPIANPLNAGSATTISAQLKTTDAAYDALTSNNSLYIAYNGADGGGAIRVNYLSSTLVLSTPKIISTYNGSLVNLLADASSSTSIIYVSFWDSGSMNAHTTVLNQTLVTITAPTQFITNEAVLHITGTAKNGTAQFLYDISNQYTYTAINTNYIKKVSFTQAGVVGSALIIQRAAGLTSKAFTDVDGTSYVLVAYQSAFQPTYFLIDFNGNIVCKIAYSNGGGYNGSFLLSSVCELNGNFYVPYLFKDSLVSANKAQGVTATGGIYTQTGINLAQIGINLSSQYNSEIAKCLNLTGGIVWQYDSVKPVELGFHIWPEDLLVTTSTTGGAITAQQYYYIFCYEWTDAQGNLHRSAPSLPAGITTTGSTSTNTINLPTLRQTYKTGQNAVRLVGYRWSTGQQSYYQFTSISTPTLNNPAVDSIAITDTLADSSILGNTLLYTTGAVVENIAPPASASTTLFRNRQFLLDAEDRNLLWYSKQILDTTPVEFSDLFTIFVAPTTGAQGSTGEIVTTSAMDDKFIILKKNSIYYFTGNGPDNTGANNDFSEPTFVTSTVGCNNADSVVVTPIGIMFQTDKGIWLLDRGLGTKYIGADVEAYNDDVIVSAVSVPGTNEVRFNLKSGAVLMYDYYFNNWGTWNNSEALSSTIWQGKHTYLNPDGLVRQETPNAYLDGTNPVLMEFTTNWVKLVGLQGYQRAYFLTMLSSYLSPYKLSVQVAYDYSDSIQQSTTVTPIPTSSTWGSEQLWGSGELWGGTSNIDQDRVFLQRQRCQSLQLTVKEIYNPEQNITAGAGFSMSGIRLMIGAKAGDAKLSAKQSSG